MDTFEEDSPQLFHTWVMIDAASVYLNMKKKNTTKSEKIYFYERHCEDSKRAVNY